MKRKITGYCLLMAITASLIVSCSTNDDLSKSKESEATEKEKENVEKEPTTGNTKPEKADMTEVSLSDLGYKNDNEMFADGWTKEIVDKSLISGRSKVDYEQEKNDNPDENSIKASEVNAEKVRMSAEQVNQLNLGHNQIKELFKINGVTPEGVTINSWTSTGAFREYNVADQYGWFAYIETGTPKITMEYLLKDGGYKTSSFVIYNQGDVEDSFQRIVSFSEGKSINWNVSTKAGVTVGGEAGVPFVAKGKVEVSFEISAGVGGSKDNVETHTYNYFGKIPAHSKRTIIVRQKKRLTKAEYSIPVVISGYVGLNFKKKVNDHYFWRGDASLLHQGKENTQLGSISVDEVYDIEIIAGPAVPIK